MKVLSIDPGYERLGVAILEKEDGKEKLIYSDCFKTLAKENHPVRLGQIQFEIQNLIKKFSPNHLAIETLFFNANVKTALLVAEARGAILATAHNSNLKIFEYSPQQIKSAVTGYGKSDKKAVSRMIEVILKPEKSIKSDDEYDAIACGIAHFASFRK
jgi:crossover junction endodeoxyribonuclease RuvC